MNKPGRIPCGQALDRRYSAYLFPYSEYILFKINSIFGTLFLGYWKINNLFKIIVVLLVALQPLHSYTVIGFNKVNDGNGFEHLHGELCGSKYSGSISHTQKLSDLLDKINTVLLSQIQGDSICCESLDTASIDLINFPSNINFVLNNKLSINYFFYAPNVKTLTPYTNQVRAPPIV